MILVYYGTPEKNYSLGTIETRIRRINKTHQQLEGIYVVKQPVMDEMEIEVNVYRQDGGGWHPYGKRFFKKACSFFHTPEGMGYPASKTFMSSVPIGCPLKTGNYTLTPVIVPRYRKDWDPNLQKIILPMLPAADTWRVEAKFYDAKKTHVCTYRCDARLINRFSSQ